MRVPEFFLSEFMNHVDQPAYLYFCETDVQVSPEQAANHFLTLRKLAVILYEWLDNGDFELKPEYREVVDSSKMLPMIQETIEKLASKNFEIVTADPHEDIPMFLKQVYECFSRVQIKENQFHAWQEYLAGNDPELADIPYSFEGSELELCSFCEKSTEEVDQIIAGPKAHICNECVGLCNNVLAEEEFEDEPEA